MPKIDIKGRVTSNLPLKPITNDKGGFKYDGFIPAVLTEVNYGTQEYKKGEFEGKNVPVLTFVWTNFSRNPKDPDRLHIHTEKVPPTEKMEGENRVLIDESVIATNIEDMWKRIKHVLDELKTSPNYRDIGDITEKQYDENFNLPEHGNVDDRLKAFEKFFKFIVEFVNGKGNQKSMLQHSKSDKGLPQWLKLVAEFPRHNRYAVPRWIRSGFVQAMEFDSKGNPILPTRLEFSASETLVLSTNTTKGAPASDGDPSSPEVEAQSVLDNMGVSLD